MTEILSFILIPFYLTSTVRYIKAKSYRPNLIIIFTLALHSLCLAFGQFLSTGTPYIFIRLQDGSYSPSFHIALLIQCILVYLAFLIYIRFPHLSPVTFSRRVSFGMFRKRPTVIYLFLAVVFLFLLSIFFNVLSPYNISSLISGTAFEYSLDEDQSVFYVLAFASFLLPAFIYFLSTIPLYIKSPSRLLQYRIISFFGIVISTLIMLLFAKKSVIFLAYISICVSAYLSSLLFASDSPIRHSRLKRSFYTFISFLIFSPAFLLVGFYLFAPDNRLVYNSVLGSTLISIKGQIQSATNITSGSLLDLPWFAFKPEYFDFTFFKYFGMRYLVSLNIELDPTGTTHLGLLSLPQCWYVLGIIPGSFWFLICTISIFYFSGHAFAVIYSFSRLNSSTIDLLFQSFCIGLISASTPIIPQIILRRILDIPFPVPIPLHFYFFPVFAISFMSIFYIRKNNV